MHRYCNYPKLLDIPISNQFKIQTEVLLQTSYNVTKKVAERNAYSVDPNQTAP